MKFCFALAISTTVSVTALKMRLRWPLRCIANSIQNVIIVLAFKLVQQWMLRLETAILFWTSYNSSWYRQQLVPDTPGTWMSFQLIPCLRTWSIPQISASFWHRFRPNLCCRGLGSSSTRRLKTACGTGNIVFVGSSPPIRHCLYFYLYLNLPSTSSSFEMGLYS